MWVEMSTESMHSALLFSMKPMPPMSAARLKTVSMPSHALSHTAWTWRSPWRLSTSSKRWYHSSGATMSTPRTFSTPMSRSRATRWPPMNPPAPVTNTFFIVLPLPLAVDGLDIRARRSTGLPLGTGQSGCGGLAGRCRGRCEPARLGHKVAEHLEKAIGRSLGAEGGLGVAPTGAGQRTSELRIIEQCGRHPRHAVAVGGVDHPPGVVGAQDLGDRVVGREDAEDGPACAQVGEHLRGNREFRGVRFEDGDEDLGARHHVRQRVVGLKIEEDQ